MAVFLMPQNNAGIAGKSTKQRRNHGRNFKFCKRRTGGER
jgi:hypothetical protein